MIEAPKRTTWNFFSGSQLTFGPGAIRTLAGIIDRRRASRILVVSDTVLVDAGIVAQVQDAAQPSAAELKLFAEGEVEPSTATVESVADVAREFKPDVVVAVGGGSNMDLSKAALACFAHQRDAESLLGFDQVPGPTPTLMCVPTTAGTGSEVTHSAVLMSSKTGRKAAILSQHIRPDVAIVDPYLTISCPPKVTAESGIDALTHAIEAYLVTSFYQFEEDPSVGLPYEGNHPLGDLYAEKAIALVGENLQRAVDQPEDLSARSAMALAATLAGAAFSSCGVSMAHALEYSIGSKFKCSHGIGNALVLPSVMRFWMPERTKRLAKIAQLLGLADASLMPSEQAAEAGINAVEQLRKTIGLPTGLSELGAKSDDIDALASTSMSLQRLLDLSPKQPSVEDTKTMLSGSM
ncbi:MAG: iron-containing alcohol dehydrogenase [Planctomycetota bacterium]